jgi:hypothetical protein
MTPKEPFYIAIKWYISDVKQARPDLSDAQAKKVLERVKLTHDANEGVNWGVIAYTVEDMYPRLRYKA